MVEFRASKTELTQAFCVVSQATDRSPATPVDGQALLRLSGEQLKIFATNKEMLASANVMVAIDSEKKESELTVDPRKLLNLIEGSDIELITFKYDEEKKILQVFASDDPEAYISFPSLDPTLFLTFDSELAKTVEIKKIDAQTFLFAIKFILGFLSNDSKNKKYQNAYIENGILYGSDGNSRLGAFFSDDFKDIDYLVLRKSMIPQLIAMVGATDPTTIVLKSTSKIILVSTENGIYNFGFTRATKEFEPPKFNIELNGETLGGIRLNKEQCLKKLNRLSISYDGSMGVDFSTDSEKLIMKSLDERASMESVPVTQVQGDGVKFVTDYKSFKNILKLFETPDVDVFLLKKGSRFQIRTKGDLVVEDKSPVKKSFVATGIISQARRK